MITNDSFYGLVCERDRVQTLLDHCSGFELSGMLEYIIDRRFPGWNKSDACFRPLRGEASHSEMLLSFYQKGKFTFADLLDAYNFVNYSSINPKFQSYYVPGGTLVEDDTPALTDDFEEVQKEVELNNPRWEHKDATKKENSSKKAAFDDTVILMADVTGIPENGPVTFDIFDISIKPPKNVGSAKGKNVGGVAKGEWVVVDKTDQGEEAKLEFQASAQGKTSTRCTIAVHVVLKIPHVVIEKLDKWFIPGAADKGGENCDLSYSLSAVDSFTGKVTFDVFGSNYCNAKVNNDFSVKFTALAADVAIYSQTMAEDKSQAGQQYDITDWNGKSTATDGALKPREGQERYINVAFSPYTAHFRCHIDDADKDARIDLLDFWPRWNKGSGAVENESLKIRWKILKTAKFKQGKLIIVDKTDGEVFTKDLADTDLTEGDHEFVWDGALSAGGQLVKENMPYRVQVQAWAADDNAQGVSAAAMHTEVRLFVHPDTGKNPDEPWKDPNSLQLGLAPFVYKEPAENEGERWYQWKLACGGFHPGPVDGQWGTLSKKSLSEFQRSYPSNDAAPFQRLTVDGAMSNASKEALKRLPEGARSLFGDPDNSNADLVGADADKRLRDKDKSMIVWVDDRHYYTGIYKAPKHIPANDPVYLNDYRGWYTAGDTKVTFDKATICRPWIPVAATIGLLSKTVGLDTTEGKFNEAVQQAIGPLCIEWSFDEIGEDVSVINTGDANYNKDIIRSRKWVEETIASAQATKNGKTFTNCPEKFDGVDCGGIRPQNLDNYYKVPFGSGSSSLEPWRAIDDTANKCLYVLSHDDVGQDAARFDISSAGKAGIYLNLSSIGGDGYRIYAKLSFRKATGTDTIKNNEVLQKRYSTPAMASSAQMRIWRRTSHRNYVQWAPAADNHWNNHRARNIELYQPAFVHIVDECGAPNSWALNTLMTAAQYADIVSKTVVAEPYTNYVPHFDTNYTWPYMDLPHLGFKRGNPNELVDAYIDRVLNPVGDDVWMPIAEELIHLLLKNTETQHGLLKGHLIAEFLSSPQINFGEYKCDTCNSTMVEVTNNCGAADLLENTACTMGGCAGHMHILNNYSIPKLGFSAIGYGLGATWDFVDNDAALWTHEIGHTKYLQHSQSWPNQPNSPDAFSNDQHDARYNPAPALAAAPAKDQCWDRACIMSYNDVEPRYFCGKCILKLRGWAVEKINNPAGNVKDA
jgi:hypothetical protein